MTKNLFEETSFQALYRELTEKIQEQVSVLLPGLVDYMDTLQDEKERVQLLMELKGCMSPNHGDIKAVVCEDIFQRLLSSISPAERRRVKLSYRAILPSDAVHLRRAAPSLIEEKKEEGRRKDWSDQNRIPGPAGPSGH